MIGWFIKYATWSIGTPMLFKNKNVGATFCEAPIRIIHGPFDISTYPSINCPFMLDIKSPFAFVTPDRLAIFSPSIVTVLYSLNLITPSPRYGLS